MPEPIRRSDLQRWKLLDDFQQRLARALPASESLHPTWSHRNRVLTAAQYYSAFLFALLNPVLRTMRGLCQATALDRVQKEVSGRSISLGSFSAAQHVLDPKVLARIFQELGQEICTRTPAPNQTSGSASPLWLIQDSTLWEALPRMHWALWRRQGRAQSAVRLHLSLHLLEDAPVRARVTPGSHCERKAWKESWQPGDAYVGDRYFGEDYRLLQLLEEKGCSCVIRIREQAVIAVEEELPVGEEDRAQKVVRQAWVRLGHAKAKVRPRVRLVWVQGPEQLLLLVTHQPAEELSAALVSQLYRQRWQIELFFRWIKCILGCRHWMAESPEGVATQIYLALIGALLLQLYIGQRPTKRMLEAVQFYLQGVATLEEVQALLQKELARLKAKKKK